MNSNARFQGKSFRPSIPDIIETDLMSVQFDSINQIELDLLGTLTTANNGENVAITDNLLDLDLESIVFSQSKQLSAVSPVPYKRVKNSQTDKSQDSCEL